MSGVLRLVLLARVEHCKVTSLFDSSACALRAWQVKQGVASSVLLAFVEHVHVSRMGITLSHGEMATGHDLRVSLGTVAFRGRRKQIATVNDRPLNRL